VHEAISDTEGAGGTVTGGGLNETYNDTATDFTSDHETSGSETLTDCGGGVETGAFTRDQSASDSTSLLETGTETFGTNAVVTGGSDGSTFIQVGTDSSALGITGSAVTIGESNSNSMSFSETGGESLGANAAVTGGSDSFTWTQHGTDSYGLGMASPGPDIFALSDLDSVSDGWSDAGTDTLGASDAITGGTDSYTIDRWRSESLSLHDQGTATSPYLLIGTGTDTFTLHDRGVARTTFRSCPGGEAARG
jgi:hypothetical protein